MPTTLENASIFFGSSPNFFGADIFHGDSGFITMSFLAMLAIWGAMLDHRKNIESSVKHFPSVTGLKCKQHADI